MVSLSLSLRSVAQGEELPDAYYSFLDTLELDEVIVSATRNARQLSSVPLNAQIISKEEIESINSVRLTDILNEQTGLITIPDFGGGEGIQLQGFDSQYTLIMIDGVPLIGRSAGTLDLNRIAVGNIRQIEVVKGASSSLYGNEALGGIINIITDRPSEGFNADLNYRGGSLNVHDLSGNVSYKNEKLQVSTFINRLSSQGFDLVDSTITNTVEPFANYTINPQITYKFSNSTNVSFSGRYFHQNQDNVVSATLSGKNTINEWNGHLKINHVFNSKWDSFFEFYATQYKAGEYLNDEDGNRFSESDFNQQFIRPEFRTTFSPATNHLLIAGMGLTNERLERTAFFSDPVFNSPYVYFQYDGSFNEKTNIIAGFRFDSHSEYSSQLSPKLAISHELSDKLSIKTSIGYGFKAPDFRQLYFDFANSTVGYVVLGYNAVPTRLRELENQGQLVSITVPLAEFEDKLEAESSVSYNLGVDFRPFPSLRVDANLFRNNVENLIDTRIIARQTNGQNVFSYFNVDEVYMQGLELNSKWDITNELSLSGGYQLLYAKDAEAERFFDSSPGVIVRDPETLQSTRVETGYFGLYNRSRHMANFKVFYRLPEWKLDANIRGTYRSKYGLFDTNGNNYLDGLDQFVDGYSVWDFAVNKGLSEHIQVGFGIDNFLDFKDPVNISNIPGRLFYGTLNLKL